MKEVIIITEENQGERLDKFLTNNRPEKSRTQWQKTIKAGLVFVNNKKVAPHYRLKSGDNLFVAEEEPGQKISSPRFAGEAGRDFKLDIVYEDDNFLVINKPAGLTVHPANANYPEETLVDLLLKKYPDLKNVGEDPLRPGIVHRLDKEVSGLMVVAKNNQAFNYLKNQFQDREVKKEYLTLIHGHLPQPSGLIDFPLDRAADGSGRMAARPKSQGGKEAMTEYEVLEKIKNYSLLKVKIKTGRTHQIRAHLNALGHPVVGDTLYHPAKMKVKDIGRLFLHASYLSFKNLAGEWREFKSELPEDLENFLAEIKK